MVVTITETADDNTISFTLDQTTIKILAVAGTFLVAGILLSVTLGVAFGAYDIGMGGQSVDQQYGVFSAEGTSYSDSSLDDADGIGLVRAGGPLVLVGLIFSFVAAVVAGTSVFVRHAGVRIATAAAGGLAFVCCAVGIVLLTVGLNQLHDYLRSLMAQFGGASVSGMSLSAGFYLAAIATLLALAGGVLSALHLRGQD